MPFWTCNQYSKIHSFVNLVFLLSKMALQCQLFAWDNPLPSLQTNPFTKYVSDGILSAETFILSSQKKTALNYQY